MSGRPAIEIEGLEVFAFHGVLAQERERGQLFLFDVRLEYLSATAAESDLIGDAVDYAAVCDRVVELAKAGPYNLLEHLADLIARDLLERFSVEAVRVRVRKPQAPIPHPFETVAVTVERRR